MMNSQSSYKKQIQHSTSGQCTSRCAKLRHEHAILARLDHENIIKCEISFHKSSSRCCLKLEQAGCDFLQYLKQSFEQRGSGNFPIVNSLFKDLASAIAYIHKQNIAHNDIKLDNCLLFLAKKQINNNKTQSSSPLTLKLADFEFASKATSQDTMNSTDISAELLTQENLKHTWKLRNTKLMSPELLNLVQPITQTAVSSYEPQTSRVNSFMSLESSIDESSDFSGSESPRIIKSEESAKKDSAHVCLKSNDVFCFGVSLFASIFGVYPYDEDARESDALYRLIARGNWKHFWNLFQDRIEYLVSEASFPQEKLASFKELIESTVTADTQKRINIESVINHPFFK